MKKKKKIKNKKYSVTDGWNGWMCIICLKLNYSYDPFLRKEKQIDLEKIDGKTGQDGND